MAINPTTRAELTKLSGDYFRSSGDEGSYAWIFPEDEPSPFLESSFEFGRDGFTIYLSDQFKGKRPILLNRDAMAGEIQLGFRPTGILDSNLVSNLHQYVTNGPALNDHGRGIVRQFLHFMVARQIDYNPFFYFIEGAAKNDAAVLSEYATQFAASILALHTMNEDRFMSTGEVVADPGRLKSYASKYGAETIEDIAPRHAEAMIAPTDPFLDGMMRLSYAGILKMALIEKEGPQSLTGKYSQFVQFMQESLNIAIGVERLLAIGFFAGEFSGFVPLQRGAKSERVLKRIQAAAWDLLLLRLPANLLGCSGISSHKDISLGYVCTSDHVLGILGRSMTIESILATDPQNHRCLPIIGYDFSILQNKIGKERLKRVLDIDTEWQRSRLPSLHIHEGRISYDGLSDLIAQLEAEVIHLCQAGS
jgi:hypothetical protein